MVYSNGEWGAAWQVVVRLQGELPLPWEDEVSPVVARRCLQGARAAVAAEGAL